MPCPASIRSANVGIASSLPYQPVAIFVGGTSGIGAGMARAFAQYRNGDAHIVLVGRNRAAAEEILASLPKPDGKEAKHEFVECDVSLMRNVRRTTAELTARLPKVNFLVMSPGIMTLQGRTESDEGIDRKLALHYYARWRFAYDLIPLLQKAKDAGEDGKVMSVLSGGLDSGEVDLNDLGLKTGYGPAAAARTTATYNNLMIQSFAEKHPTLSFLHIAPGVVRTPIIYSLGRENALMSLTNPLISILGYALGVSADECAEYMWRGMFASGKGWSRWSKHGEDVGEKNLWSTPEAQEKVWRHTLEATS